MGAHLALRRLHVSVASGDALDVREFHVVERMSSLFEVSVVALSENPDIDLEAVAGQPMSFTVRQGTDGHEARTWTGLCSHVEQVGVEDRGLSSYRIVLVPTLWLLTQRRNSRMFQLVSELDIAQKLLGEWGVPFELRVSGSYKKRKYRVQYGETDFAFLCRMLEDAGISFCFRDGDAGTTLVLTDAPQSSPPRSPPIAFRDRPTEANREHVTAMRIGRRVRPGSMVMRDHDHRRPPSFRLVGTAGAGGGVEGPLEQFEYAPGSFLFESAKGDPTPVADDRGRYRTDEKEGAVLAQRRLAAQRAGARTVTFDTNTIDLAPGTVVSFLDHPKSELAPGKGFLVTAAQLSGEVNGKWLCTCEAADAALPHHPPMVTPKPKTSGVESATVVGPPGEEIHTDEFGRVRVHFHWDRESKMDASSSCWIHVSQPWSGSGFGATNLPRVGQEVVVDFLGGDPDRPIIVGRVFTNLQKTPYKLPDNKTQSGWKSRSTPGGGPSNYNEIMFEDRRGQELVRVQAEKDLDKLVKNDEAVRIGRDRAKRVGHDDALQVGHDRTREVGHDEAIAIGNDRALQVGHDELEAVAHDRSRLVGNDEDVTVGNDRRVSVGFNDSLFVGGNRMEQIGASRKVTVEDDSSERIGENMSLKVGGSVSESIGKMKKETVKLASAETVGGAKALSVGAAYAVSVGGMMTTNVGLVQTQTVGRSQTETVGTTKTITVGEKLEIVCGDSSIVLEKSGKVTITGTEVLVNGKQVAMVGTDSADVYGAKVTITGDSIHNN